MDAQAQDTSSAGAFLPRRMYLEHGNMAEGARKRIDDELRKKKTWLAFLSCRSSTKKVRHDSNPGRLADGNREESVPPSTICDPLKIEFGDERIDEHSDCTSDQFKWAVLYENQRGFVFFSTPYYSSRSLLPRDPPAFTSLDAEHGTPFPDHISRKITLESYSLPDPTWRWVSNTWFVDMRGDGEVQHDGFEYNWSFRQNKWRSKVGWFSAGGFVRRRRWVRLMVRPSDAHLEAETTERRQDAEDKASESLIPIYEPNDSPLWRGDECDWQRLRKVLKIVSRDGPKLELWKAWLTDMITERGPGKDKCREISKDHVAVVLNEGQQLPEERPSREWVLSILKEHGKDFRHVFIFPESRVRFGTLLLKAGLLQDLLPDAPDDETRISTVLGPSDFWDRPS